MRDVFGAKNWVFWWAALTATIFLQGWLPTIANFFQDNGFFSPSTFPFSLVSGLNAWIDSVAQGIENAVSFDPNALIISSPIAVPNWILAVLVGLGVLAGAIALYVRALRSASIGDDIITLVVLYFVIRIEAYILGLTNLGPLSSAGQFVIENPLAGFWIMMIALFVLIFLGGGMNNRRSFWRGLLEGVILALFLVPAETAQWISTFFAGLNAFGALLMSNPVFGVAWGVVGAVLALTRLTGTQTA